MRTMQAREGHSLEILTKLTKGTKVMTQCQMKSIEHLTSVQLNNMLKITIFKF